MRWRCGIGAPVCFVRRATRWRGSYRGVYVPAHEPRPRVALSDFVERHVCYRATRENAMRKLLTRVFSISASLFARRVAYCNAPT